MALLFRRNVAAILEDGQGKILIAERSDVPGAWQFPQGGVDDGESDREALEREVAEELGIGPKCYKVLEQKEGYRYQFPNGRKKNGKYNGQEQVYFRCRFTGRDSDIDLKSHVQEFSRFRWIRPERFELAWVPEFKREVFAAVFKDFYKIKL